MKEFLIEDFTVNNDNSVTIEYYFYSEFKEDTFTEDQVSEVFKLKASYELLYEDFDQDHCIALLKHYIRNYAPKKQKIQ
jgi:hypothetical protein